MCDCIFEKLEIYDVSELHWKFKNIERELAPITDKVGQVGQVVQLGQDLIDNLPAEMETITQRPRDVQKKLKMLENNIIGKVGENVREWQRTEGDWLRQVMNFQLFNRKTDQVEACMSAQVKLLVMKGDKKSMSGSSYASIKVTDTVNHVHFWNNLLGALESRGTQLKLLLTVQQFLFGVDEVESLIVAKIQSMKGVELGNNYFHNSTGMVWDLLFMPSGPRSSQIAGQVNETNDKSSSVRTQLLFPYTLLRRLSELGLVGSVYSQDRLECSGDIEVNPGPSDSERFV